MCVEVESGTLCALFTLVRVIVEVGALGTALALFSVGVKVLLALGTLFGVLFGLLATNQGGHSFAYVSIGPSPILAAA